MANLKSDICVLVTRPRHQSRELVDRLEAVGVRVWLAPMVEIQALGGTVDASTREQLSRPSTTAIFLSPNAARIGLDLVRGNAVVARLVAMGPGTARAIGDAGYAADLTPVAGTTSETLLQRPEFQSVDAQSFVVFQGEGGRELIQSTLRQRGASVISVVCYRRQPPDCSADDFTSQWATQRPDAVLVTSETALTHLLSCARDVDESLREIDIVVISERLANVVQNHGWRGSILVAPSPSDDAIIETVTARYGN